MPWIKFTADFDFKPRPAVTIGHTANTTRLVNRACAEAAQAAGKAIPAKRPAKTDTDAQSS